MRQKVGRVWVDMGPMSVLSNPLSGGPLQTRSQRFTTSCIHGHVRTPDNTYFHDGMRILQHLQERAPEGAESGVIRGTPDQIHALDALCVYGSYKNAAFRLRRSESAIRRHIHALRMCNNMTTNQLAFYRGLETREEAA